MKEKIKVLLPEAEVDKKIQELGEQISKDYEGKNIHMICVLKGGVFFTCELAKRISVPVSLDFMSVSSYGNGTTSSGAVRIVKDLDEPLEGKDVLIVEDIIDTGLTLAAIQKVIQDMEPSSLEITTLLDKPSRRVEHSIVPKYVGFTIPDEFVVGFGLDYNEQYRNLPYIGVLKEEVYK